MLRCVTISVVLCVVFSAGTDAAVDCNKVGPCLLNNLSMLKGLMTEAQAAQANQDKSNPNATDAQLQKICASFQPIIDCTGRDAAAQCSFSIGKRGQKFRLYYLTVLCEVTVKLRNCTTDMQRAAMTTPPPRICPGVNATAITTTTPGPTTSPGTLPKPVCSQQFPDIEDEAAQVKNQTSSLSTTPLPDADDPYAAAGPGEDEESIIDSFSPFSGEKCARAKLYIGCWLYYGRQMCGTKITSTIQSMYQIYNDVSGSKCSTESPENVDYGAFEADYLRQYGNGQTPCPSNSTTTTTTAASAGPSRAIMANTQPPTQKATSKVVTTKKPTKSTKKPTKAWDEENPDNADDSSSTSLSCTPLTVLSISAFTLLAALFL